MSRRNESPEHNEAPEPPKRWRPDSSSQTQGESPDKAPDQKDSIAGMMGSTRVELTSSEIAAFESARRLVTVSQIAALVSFIIGGVALSAIALICAVVAYRKLDAIAAGKQDHPEMQHALRRVGVMALGLSAVALVINIVALVVLYPVIMNSLQSGGFGSLFGGSGQLGAGGGNSTWG